MVQKYFAIIILFVLFVTGSLIARSWYLANGNSQIGAWEVPFSQISLHNSGPGIKNIPPKSFIYDGEYIGTNFYQLRPLQNEPFEEYLRLPAKFCSSKLYYQDAVGNWRYLASFDAVKQCFFSSLWEFGGNLARRILTLAIMK